jgi:hypothetical protein
MSKMHVRFYADEALMYLIQQTTKLPTEDILGFFYELGVKVAEIGFVNMSTNRSIRKDIRDIFPKSNIPFKLLVKGYKHVQGDFTGHIEVSFPDACRGVDHQALLEKIIEKTLLDGESLPDFPRPVIKTPKMYKDLMKHVIEGTNLICKESATNAK